MVSPEFLKDMDERSIVGQALAIADETERQRFIATSCAGDPALRARVEERIRQATEQTADRSPSGQNVPGVPPGVGSDGGGMPESRFRDPLVGLSIGGVRIVRMISEGGMGRVYEGRQENPRRTVAVKLVKPGVASEKVLRRFEFEAQVLGRLRHPGIAQIHAAGTFGEGAAAQPYFVMEYIAGAKPLTQYAVDLKLSTHERLGLFQKVCDAVAHGHQNGVIHRDLKPSNILVDSTGQPKVIDFGVAKTTDSDMALTTLQTDVGQLIGTYQYMSPEQFDADPHAIDIRSDVYALGVVLYELLAGQPPYDLKKKLPHEISGIVRQHDPTPITLVNKALRRDVGVIAGKCLEKDRNRRYSSASELAGDIGRYLVGDPITAIPPGFWDGVVRLARRHRGAMAAVACVAASLVAAVLGISVFAIRAEQAKREADVQRDAARAERATATVERDAAEQAREAEAEQRVIAERQRALAEANEQIASKQARVALESIQYVLSEVDARLRAFPGMSDLRLAILDALSTKIRMLDEGMAGGIRGELVPTLMAMRQLAATVYRDLGRMDEANREYAELYRMSDERIALKGRNDATRSNRAKIGLAWSSTVPPNRLDLLETTVSLARECLTDPQPLEGSPSREDIEEVLAAGLQGLGLYRLDEGRLTDAATHLEEAIGVLGGVLEARERSPELAALDAEQRAGRMMGSAITLGKLRTGLAYVYLRLGRTGQAIPLYEAVIADTRNSLALQTREERRLAWRNELAGYLGNFGQSLIWIGEVERATPVLEESLALYEVVRAADPEKMDFTRHLATALYRLAVLRDVRGQAQEAAPLQERCLSLRRELVAGARAYHLNHLMLSLARCGLVEETLQVVDEAGAESGIDPARALAQLIRHVPEADRATSITRAVQAVERAVEDGFSDAFRLRVEPDLQPLQEDPRFLEIIARLPKQF